MKTQLTNYKEIAEKYFSENDVNFIVKATGREFMMKYGREKAMEVLSPFNEDLSFLNSVDGLVSYFEAIQLDWISLDNMVGTLIFIK